MTVKVVSLNCKSLKRVLVGVRELCREADIVLLQETWLLNSELGILNDVHHDFSATGCSAVDDGEKILIGRPFGGLAILWRKSLGLHVDIIPTSDSRILAIRCTSGSTAFGIINVYLPVDSPSNQEAFDNYVGEIYSTVDVLGVPCAIAMGDWNSGIHSTRLRDVEDACCESAMHIIDVEWLGKDSESFTYVSDATGSTSWIDHVVGTEAAASITRGCEILYDVILSDHLPLKVTLDLEGMATTTAREDCTVHKDGRHAFLSHSSTQHYAQLTRKYLNDIKLIPEVLDCVDTNCNSLQHRVAIDDFFGSIVECLGKASCEVPHPGQKKITGRRRYRRAVPGWTGNVSEAYKQSQLAFGKWKNGGKRRHGEAFTAMVTSRKVFKRALRGCRQREAEHRNTSLAQSALQHDWRGFWSNLSRSNKQDCSPSTVDGTSGNHNIAELWATKFETLLNASLNLQYQEDVLTGMEVDVQSDFFSTKEIKDACSSFALGKACGSDGLRREHFRFAWNGIHSLLADGFNACVVHGWLPKVITDVTITPVPKNRTGSLTDSDNYRPIALASVLSLVLEKVLLRRLQQFLETMDNQFGFKAKHSTEQAIHVLKETVRHYRSQDSPVYVCLLDVSKAYDRVNWWPLFRKLLDRGVPTWAVRLLVRWYSVQELSVRWNGWDSRSFGTSNGVRQGGILSPALFGVYMDSISKVLSEEGVGCHVGGTCVNNICYADDLAILCPSAKSLQRLLSACEQVSQDLDFVFNPEKSVCLLFRPKSPRWRSFRPPGVTLANKPVKFVTSARFLGHIITENLCDDDDIRRQCRSLCIAGNALKAKFSLCDRFVKNRLFKAHCTNLYTGALWMDYKKASMDKLRVSYNNAARRLHGRPTWCSASQLMVENNLPSFGTVRRTAAWGVRSRMLSSENSLVQAVMKQSVCKNVVLGEWHDVLYGNHL